LKKEFKTLVTKRLDGSKTNTRSNCLFSELRIKLACCYDISYRPSTRSWKDKVVDTSE